MPEYLIWSAPSFHQTDTLVSNSPTEGSNVYLYFVDTCGDCAQLTGTSMQTISDMERHLRGPSFAPASVVKRDICSVMALMPTEKTPEESGKLCAMLSGLGIRLIFEHPTYKHMRETHRVQHWLFLGFRLFDGGYICEPIALNEEVANSHAPVRWPALMHMLPAIIESRTDVSRPLGSMIKKSGGAILAPSFKIY